MLLSLRRCWASASILECAFGLTAGKTDLRADGNVSAAADALGMSRATLYRKLRRLDLRRDRRN
jgi:Bacterial regulatory protein, Fis family